MCLTLNLESLENFEFELLNIFKDREFIQNFLNLLNLNLNENEKYFHSRIFFVFALLNVQKEIFFENLKFE